MRGGVAGFTFILAIGVGMADLSCAAERDGPLPGTPGAAPHDSALPYRCERDGRTTYQSQPCGPGDRQSEVGRGTFNIVTGGEPGGVSAPRPDALARERPATATRRDERERTAAACARHAQAIARIDSKARQGGRGSVMDRLAAARRRHQDERWRLKCAF